jgi:hypothetical protein
MEGLTTTGLREQRKRHEMESGKPWIRGGEKESALAAPGLSGSEGG